MENSIVGSVGGFLWLGYIGRWDGGLYRGEDG